MKKSLFAFLAAAMLTLFCSAAALAYNPGQRTFELLGSTLNSDKHPVHMVVSQTIDMKDVLTPEAYAKLTPDKQKRVNITEYNEANGINGEINIIKDGSGNIISHKNSFVKGGYWYTIDYINKSYDRLPELPGMSLPFAETLVSWFSSKPEAGYDVNTGWDYDVVTKGTNTLRFYFERGTNNWKGYEVSYLPMFTVLEYGETVDAETAFALPPDGFKQEANQTMRNYANRLMQRK